MVTGSVKSLALGSDPTFFRTKREQLGMTLEPIIGLDDRHNSRWLIVMR